MYFSKHTLTNGPGWVVMIKSIDLLCDYMDGVVVDKKKKRQTVPIWKCLDFIHERWGVELGHLSSVLFPHEEATPG